MTAPLIDSDILFQSLIVGLDLPDVTVKAAIDADTFDKVPFISHSSTMQQSGNGRGLWTCVLNVNVFIEGRAANYSTVSALYAGIHSWADDPTAGILPGVAGVEEVEDIEAFSRAGQGVVLQNKVITPYQGSFTLTIRNH